MTTEERRNEILSIINNSIDSIKTTELASLLDVTTETIRKDLIFLENRRLIKKFHGGAKPVAEFVERSLGLRQNENTNCKIAIAKAALEQIAGSSVIYIDAGSTTCELAKLLAVGSIQQANLQRAIVTNSFTVANELTGSIHTRFFLGGDISDVTQSTGGLWAINALNSIKIDVAFLGSSGFYSHHGPGTKISGDALLKSEVTKNANKIVILADHTKFTSNAIMQFAEWSQIDLLITDSKVEQEHLEEIRKSVNVIVAEVPESDEVS